MSGSKMMQFGHHVNDKNQPLEWYVLCQTANTQLLLCKDCIVKGPYLDSREETSWEDSKIRKWLNETLYNSIFESEQKQRILLTTRSIEETVVTKEIAKVTQKDGMETEYVTFAYPRSVNHTNDKIFLLSIQQFRSYITDPTVAIASYENETNNETVISWWLQDEGFMGSDKIIVDKNGKTAKYKQRSKKTELQFSVDGCSTAIGVRPAIFIKNDIQFTR